MLCENITTTTTAAAAANNNNNNNNAGYNWSISFLFQRISSVLVQRSNAVLLNDSFVLEHHLD